MSNDKIYTHDDLVDLADMIQTPESLGTGGALETHCDDLSRSLIAIRDALNDYTRGIGTAPVTLDVGYRGYIEVTVERLNLTRNGYFALRRLIGVHGWKLEAELRLVPRDNERTVEDAIPQTEDGQRIHRKSTTRAPNRDWDTIFTLTPKD